MTRVQASDLLVDALEREGVEYVFGLPGEENEDLLFSLQDSSIRFVPTRHEQGAAFMADVHGRLTGDAGVCLSTLGPGATNLLTGVADAHLDKSPLVAITGQGNLERLHKESHQRIDVVHTFEPVTKWNVSLTDQDIVHESVRKAFKLAEYEKPGATHLELPEDVAGAETPKEPLAKRDPVGPARPNEAALERVADLLSAADRPLVIAGNGAVRTAATDHLRRLVEVTEIPVVSTYMGKGAVPDDDPRSLMTLDSGPEGEAADAIGEADLILTVGYDIAEHDPAEWYRKRITAPIIHLDSEPAEVYEAYNPEVEIVADIGETTCEIADWCESTDHAFETDWYERLREDIVTAVDRDLDGDAPFPIRDVISGLRDVMTTEDVLLSDVGTHKMEIARNFRAYEPNTVIISNGLATMGIAVPGAVAADLVVDGNVVAATGDGGFLMNAAELETATRLDCGFTVVVFTDGEYRLISEKQQDHRGTSFGTHFTNPDLTTFAESFGIESYLPETADELREALTAVDESELSLVAVPVQYSA